MICLRQKIDEIEDPNKNGIRLAENKINQIMEQIKSTNAETAEIIKTLKAQAAFEVNIIHELLTENNHKLEKFEAARVT